MNIYWIKFGLNILLLFGTWIVVHMKIISLKDYFCDEEAFDVLFVISIIGTIVCAFIPYARIVPFIINAVAIIVMFNIDRVLAVGEWFIGLGKK